MKSAYDVIGEISELKSNIQRADYVKSAMQELSLNSIYSVAEQKINTQAQYGNKNFTLDSGDRNPLLLTAHYDAFKKLDSDEIVPGANDNASGVSAALSLAKKLEGLPVDIVLFGSEECGIQGSREYARHKINPFDKKIRGVINLDCVGLGSRVIVPNTTGWAYNVYDTNKKMNEVLIKNFKKVGMRTISKEEGTPSDHISFVSHGVPASNISGNDIFRWRRKIHTDRDRIETIDKAFLEDIIEGTAMSVKELLSE